MQGKEVNEASLKAARIQAVASLEAQTDHFEKQATETSSSVTRVVREIKSLFPLIEVLFSSLGCDSALSRVGRVPDGPMSPLSKQTASLAMYASPALAEEVKEGGITTSTLPHFMGMLENRGADVIQLYAAMISTGALAEDGAEGVDSAEQAALKAEADELKLLQAVESAASGALADDGGAAAAAAAAVAAAATMSATAASDAPGRFFSAAALGPSRPTGKLKESLTTSSLVAAMAVAASAGPLAIAADTVGGGTATRRGGGVGSGARGEPSAGLTRRATDDADPEDNAPAPRPLSLEELKKQASSQLAGDKSVRVISSAAAVAATVLGRGAHAS